MSPQKVTQICFAEVAGMFFPKILFILVNEDAEKPMLLCLK